MRANSLWRAVLGAEKTVIEDVWSGAPPVRRKWSTESVNLDEAPVRCFY